ncbi:solute carrier family 7 protein [Westerdykella ornata]|uniref:Solute carrier family 7 protein n=1 Tax=Westerdykella ornata TaxID=318751 RepID=A0A6A6JM49_WESOR|nr:solute carrier family 7 protein [Westerdykella ornata]KAF2277305.1 solute carrier family 7 protein [Westerdykella ornata]
MASESTPLLHEGDQHGSSLPEVAHTTRSTFARRLNAKHAFVLITTIVIGSGVFSSPGPVDANVPSPGVALLVWLLGGFLAWTGALTMAELGTAIPGEGGIQPYLSHIYGEVWGFLAGWSWIVATMPATLAILSIVFVESVYSAFGWDSARDGLAQKGWSVLVLVIVTIANSISTKTSTRLGDFFVVIKFSTIFLLILSGLTVLGVFVAQHGRDLGGGDWYKKRWFAARDSVLPDGRLVDWSEVGAWELLGFFSTALYASLWSFSGWDKANYVAAELRNPSKQLPLSVNTAIPTIILCYLAANTVYYILLPWNVVSVTDAAAVTAISHFLGQGPAFFATILICLVIAGSALGNSFVAGRMTVAAANKRWLPGFLGSVGEIGRWKVSSGAVDAENSDEDEGAASEAANEAMDKGEAPINALVLNTLLSSLYILLGNMRILLTLNGLSEYSFFFLTVTGAIILRFREPDLHRPIKPPLVVPVLFALISGFVVVRGALFAPVQAAVLVGVWAVGFVWWAVRVHGIERLRSE